MAATGFSVVLAAGVTAVAAPSSVSSATQTVVSLTFDNGVDS